MASSIQIFLGLILATQCVAAALSFLIVFGLLIPLFIQLNNGSYYERTAQQQRRGRRREAGSEPPYSTYNLYLVYLAVFDLAYLLPTIAAEFCTLTQNFCHPRFWSLMMIFYRSITPEYSVDGLPVDLVINGPYGCTNLWLNAVIVHQVWKLLKASHRGQRITQPSLLRVNLHGGGMILGSTLFGVVNYYHLLYVDAFSINEIEVDDDILQDSLNIYEVDDDKIDSTFLQIIFDSVILITYSLFIYVIGMAVFVKCCGYLPPINGSTPTGRAVRGLTLYFFRVAAIFLSIWVPSVICLVLTTTRPSLYLALLVYFLIAFQPILTFCLILSKPDVKKYIKDLVTLTYLPGRCTCCTSDAEGVPVGSNETTNVSNPEIANERLKSNTILGYTFEDRDSDNDSDQNDDTHSYSAYDDVGQETTAEINAATSMVDEDDATETKQNEDQVDAADDAVDDIDIAVDTVVNIESDRNSKYKSRRIRGGPAAGVLAATGQAYDISLRRGEGQAEVP